ncbi:cystathionine beta-lyase [Cupriavidus lacunae]|uniref:Cystathionine beta-lyase n=2 Tax=Cupriavidus lacunae TaxID=2666307 RepID=A0A370NNM4_9BURK|nr:cystathionine beta-lyase [Cupriavidus lacunae]
MNQATVEDTKVAGFKSLSPAVWRASTVLFNTVDEFTSRKDRLYDGYTYGVTGTPTNRALEERIAEFEGGAHCVLAPSGQAALCMVGLALVRAGDHVLVSDSAYGPLKTFLNDWLSGYGVAVDVYPPTAGSDLESHIQDNTKLIFLESPGSLTMEMQDIPAIVAIAKRRGILTVIDNTWATPLGFKPLDQGVDICVEAGSKLFGGHSDVLLGSIATNHRWVYEKMRHAQSVLGQAVSAEDCFLVLRGLDTLAVRYAHQCNSAIEIASWLAKHEQVELVMFPPLQTSPGHEVWARSFQGGGCVLSFIPTFQQRDEVHAFFAALTTFSIGASWGGVHSLAAFYPATEFARRKHCEYQRGIVRLSVGLEPVSSLVTDLEKSLASARARNS